MKIDAKLLFIQVSVQEYRPCARMIYFSFSLSWLFFIRFLERNLVLVLNGFVAGRSEILTVPVSEGTAYTINKKCDMM
jgi:hypothetical protein